MGLLSRELLNLEPESMLLAALTAVKASAERNGIAEKRALAVAHTLKYLDLDADGSQD